jgi:hypothetical protein
MSPLLPIAGTAAISLAGETVGAIGNGLAFATELLRQDNDAARAASAPPPIELPPSPAQSKFEQALRDFVARLKQRLAAAEIALSGPLVLESDGLGGIQVEGEMVDERAIEQALDQDAQLLAEFDRLAKEHAASGGALPTRGFTLLVYGDDAVVPSE